MCSFLDELENKKERFFQLIKRVVIMQKLWERAATHLKNTTHRYNHRAPPKEKKEF